MRRGLETMLWWPVLVLVWLATMSTPSWQEAGAAAVLAVPCAFAAGAARRLARDRWRPRARWARGLRTLPVAIARDTAAIFVAVGSGHEGRLDRMHIPVEQDEDVRITREALSAAALSATPGTVVLDGSAEHDCQAPGLMETGLVGFQGCGDRVGHRV